jgi:GR25 family glycosyltransferase involved in LPS biosynthesis
MKIEGIDNIYCINLEKRPDRRKEAYEEFKKFDLDFEFFYGVDGSELKVNSKIKPGHVGCVMSHLNMYRHLKEQDGDIFMITEDDVVFDSDFISKYLDLVRHVPSDWHLLYFGGNHNGIPLNMVSPNIHRLQKTYTTHCYVVKKEYLDILIGEFDTPAIFNSEVDVHLSNLQTKVPCYGFTPALAWQKDGFSDIEMKHVEYNFLKK